MNFEEKVVYFMTAIQDLYRDKEDRESFAVPKLDINNGNLTEDFTALFWAIFMWYRALTGDDIDVIDFLSVCNRLAFQHIAGDLDNKEDE